MKREAFSATGWHDDDRKTLYVAKLDDYDVIANAVCAFINGDGGTIVCGIDSLGNLIGVPESDQPLLDRLENRLQHDITPKPLMTVEVIPSDKLRTVIINVPAGLDAPYMYQGRMMVSKGGQVLPADAYDLRARVQARSAQPIRWERRPAENLLFDDLIVDEILETADAARKGNIFRFATPEDPQSVLRELGMLGPNGLSNATDVAFARDPSVRNPQCRARVLQFSSSRTARTGMIDRHFSGPVSRVYDQMLEALRAVLVVRSTFMPERSRREDRPDFAFEAVREGLVNALAHRDYASFSGGLTVSIYSSRIEIWNSGRLPQELEAKSLARTSRSLPVNPDITRVLHYRGLMESVGRGTRLIADECRMMGAKAPVWKDEPTGVTLTIFAAKQHEFGILPLNPRQAALLEKIRIGEHVSPSSYHESYAGDVSDRQARRDLKELEQDGYLVREKGGHSSAYRRTDLPYRSEDK